MDSGSSELTFTFMAKRWTGAIALTLSADGGHVRGEAHRDVDAATLESLTAWPPERAFRQADAPHVAEVLIEVAEAKRHLLALIDQELAFLAIHELNAGPTEWSADSITWHSFPHLGISAHVSVRSLDRMTLDRAQKIQSLLDAGEAAMVAYRQLQYAEQIRPNDASWIIATVAAEIAIKETLSSMEPALEQLLDEVPSPPIGVLYGKILMGLSGESSPFVKQLQEGAARRNRLVHRASRSTPSHDERDAYIQVVAGAIEHLIAVRRRLASQRDVRTSA